jgi:IS5 family transposase
MERELSQPTFVDAMVADAGSKKLADFFADIDRLVPWDDLAARCGDVFAGDAAPHKGGQPHRPVKLMLKCQFLQACFNLSDPALEEAVNDRLSFRRFLGLSLVEKAPDETTVCKFRTRMIARGHGSTVFDCVKQTLAGHGLILREGTLVDALLIERGRGGWSRASSETSDLHTADGTAGRTRHGGRGVRGHKATIATDVRGTIVDFVYDTAATHESNHFEQLTENETRAAWADKAFWSKKRMAELPRRGVFPGIGIKRMRGQPALAEEQKAHNRLVRRVRAAVEHPIALMRKLGLRRLAYRGLGKNAFRFSWVAAVVNIKRNLDPWRAGLQLSAA